MNLDSSTAVAHATRPPERLDYSLTGKNAVKAIELGLAEADWYQTPVPRKALRKLLERRDGPAIRDTLLWFGLLGITGWGTVALWGTWCPSEDSPAPRPWPMVPAIIWSISAKCGHLP